MVVRRLLLENYIWVNRLAKTNNDYIIYIRTNERKEGKPERRGMQIYAVYASARCKWPRGATIYYILDFHLGS